MARNSVVETAIKEITNRYVVAMVDLLGEGKSGMVEAELTLSDDTEVKVTFQAKAANKKAPVKKAPVKKVPKSESLLKTRAKKKK